MSYIMNGNSGNFRRGLGAFGKGAIAPAPPAEDTGPGITPEEEMAILQAMLPASEQQPALETSFFSRNSMPILIGGGVIVLGAVSFILLS